IPLRGVAADPRRAAGTPHPRRLSVVSPQRPVDDRRRDTQATTIPDRRRVEQIGIDRVHETLRFPPPLSIEHIIAQLQQLRDLLPAPLGDSHDER
ncbi:MAG: hypothetical protein ACRDTT_23555, partial [Pseudonocardiaceae bacterium]